MPGYGREKRQRGTLIEKAHGRHSASHLRTMAVFYPKIPILTLNGIFLNTPRKKEIPIQCGVPQL